MKCLSFCWSNIVGGECMDFEPMYKVYYKRPQDWQCLLDQRRRSESSIQLPIGIHEYNRRNTYSAFFMYHPELIDLLLRIESKRYEFMQYVEQIPTIIIGHLMNAFLSTEIKASNDIEGVRSSRREIQEAIDNTHNSKLRFSSIITKYKMIVQHNELLTYKNSAEIRQLYDEVISSEIKKRDLPDGTLFRKDSVDVVNHQQKVIHQGTTPESEIIKEMNKALDILNDESIQLPIRVAIFHYYFGYIHPFYDGNGRTNRFISTVYLAHYFHPLIALRLSAVIKNSKKNYYDAFKYTNSEFNGGDVTTFIIPFIKIIESTINDAIRLLDKRIVRLQDYSKKLEKYFEINQIHDPLLQSIYFLLLQANLFSLGAGINKQEIMAACNKSRGTIYNRFKKIPDSHITKIKRGRVESYTLKLSMLDSINRL